MNIASNAAQYDWQTWGLGVFRSFISGGSAAMVAGLTTMGIAPGLFAFTFAFRFRAFVGREIRAFLLGRFDFRANVLRRHPITA